MIGGTTAAARNVVSDNVGFGIDIEPAATGATIQGNYIGTDTAGSRDGGATGSGVFVNAAGTTIGGTAPGAGNVISGHSAAGLTIGDIVNSGVVVQGNRIGTDKDGTIAVANGTGVLIQRASGVVVGGTTAGAGNVISGNTGSGQGISGATATGNVGQGNFVGTNASGSASLGNVGDGVAIHDAGDNLVGGGIAGAGNPIGFNLGAGVSIDGTSLRNTVRRNAIFGNGSLGIDLPALGAVQANDLDDADAGPNGLQNFPIVATVATTPLGTDVAGTLQSTPNATFTLNFYSDPALDASGHGEARLYLGSRVVTTDVAGNASFATRFPTVTPKSHRITATATGPDGGTSELAASVWLNRLPVGRAGPDRATDEGSFVMFDGRSSTDPDGDELSFSWDFGDGKTATGATPFHAWEQDGTYTVTLTVDDGFGGTATDTAVITVRNAAPVLAERSFSPVQTFGSAALGDSFGGRVAAIVEFEVARMPAAGTKDDQPDTIQLIAVAARLDDTGAADSGVVHLIDARTGLVLKTLLNPTPTAGEEFGSAMAVVGNYLVVGAPNDGDNGSAYLFDVNPNSGNFGTLLHTFAMPSGVAQGEPTASLQAGFGAAVAGVGTRVLIGAPGNDVGGNASGRAYLFDADPTRPTYRQRRLTIANPAPAVGDNFGSTVLALGDDLLITASGDDISGPSSGAVYRFVGFNGALKQTFLNPRPDAPNGPDSFGYALAVVGRNVAISSDLDDFHATQTGAVYLFDPDTGGLVGEFARPHALQRGRFGFSLAAAGTTLVIGAPDDNSGRIGAGAAFVYDGDPNSPAFLKPTAALQRPDLTPGDGFGSSVAFLDDDVFIGAPRSVATGNTEGVFQFCRDARLGLNLRPTFEVVSPRPTTYLHGVIADPGIADIHVVTIDWGDDSPVTILNLSARETTFYVAHRYADDAADPYSINVSVADEVDATAAAGTSVVVRNLNPVLATPILNVSSIDEDGTVNLNGSFTDDGQLDRHTLLVDWGDGSPTTTLSFAPGLFTKTFAASHRYLNNPAGAANSFPIHISVADDDWGSDARDLIVAVANVAPSFGPSPLSLNSATIAEDETVTLTGTIVDPGTLDAHTVTIDWRDGTTTTLTPTRDQRTFSASHRYLDDPAGAAVGYDIRVTVADAGRLDPDRFPRFRHRDRAWRSPRYRRRARRDPGPPGRRLRRLHVHLHPGPPAGGRFRDLEV